ncbi:MAG: Ig-like domain-containing protein [Nanoarchaeota archaeon]
MVLLGKKRNMQEKGTFAGNLARNFLTNFFTTGKKVLLGIFLLLILGAIVNSALAAVRIYHVRETDFVRLSVNATDADKDKVSYYYSEPLDENGEWQTDYGDAGVYNITIIASDGVNEVKKDVRLIVDKKNQPPHITESRITVKETQMISLKEFVSDPDGNPLEFTFSEPFDKEGKWQTDYNDAGSYVAVFKVSDGEFITDGRIGIEILNTNQPPQITGSFSAGSRIPAREDQTLDFYADAYDSDNDRLTYSWKLDGKALSEEKEAQYYFSFDSSGKHNLTFVVSDGINGVTKEWVIDVENVNRKPVLVIPPIEVSEGDIVDLELPEKDLDGDDLTYRFEDKFDEKGRWQTEYNDAGTYRIDVIASDGKLKAEQTVEITVLDVDRAPAIDVPDTLEVKEGEKLVQKISSVDPDGDAVIIEFRNAPEGATFNQKTKTFSWQPNYDFIKRKGGIISDLLNVVRLENRILQSRNVVVDVISCGKDLCMTKAVTIIVQNSNRKPVLEKMEPITGVEGETIFLRPTATDPDGDIVTYFFSEPVGKLSGKWTPGYNDAGSRIVYVTAADGLDSDAVPVNITVSNKNRPPTISVDNEEITVNEGRTFSFRVNAQDPDGDEIALRLENIPPGASFKDGFFEWQPNFVTVKNSSRTRWTNFISRSSYLNKKLSSQKDETWLQFVASDGEFDVVHPVKIIIKNVNQQPEVVDYLPAESVTAEVGQSVVFHLAAKDIDNDRLDYRWDLGAGQEDVFGTDTIERTFSIPGKKVIEVTASDGLKKVKKVWNVDVVDTSDVDTGENYADGYADFKSDIPFTVYVKVIEN